MRMISLINQKGGVGKTTVTANLGDGLSRAGKKVLLIDLDPQAHLTKGLGINPYELERTVYDLLRDEIPPREVWIETKGFTLIPSSLGLSGADLTLGGIAGREFLLKDALDHVRGFDYVLIDCPPSLGLLTLNALIAAREVIIVTEPEYYALTGIVDLVAQTIEPVRKRLNKHLKITGVIVNRYNGRLRLYKETVGMLRDHFGDKLFKTYIRNNVSLPEAPSHGKTIFEYRPSSHGAEDFLELTKEVERRGKE